LYIGGWGAVSEDLSEHPDDVKAQPEEIRKMVALAKRYLKVDSEEELEISDVDRCYRPLATPNRPIVTEVDWKLLRIGSGEGATPAPNSWAQICDRH
jgi:hypothetical protein